MTNEQKQEIREMRNLGIGYGTIAAALGISENTVKSYCRRNIAKTPESRCEYCNTPVSQTPGRKQKRFCSNKCRMSWWNAAYSLRTCP